MGKRIPWLTANQVIGIIQDRGAAGLPLNSEVLSNDKRFAFACWKRFGSIKNAVIAAGYDPEAVKAVRVWNRERCIRGLVGLWNEGESLMSKDVWQNHKSLYVGCLRHLGVSWWEVLRAAGFNPREYSHYKKQAHRRVYLRVKDPRQKKD